MPRALHSLSLSGWTLAEAVSSYALVSENLDCWALSVSYLPQGRSTHASVVPAMVWLMTKADSHG